VFNERLDAKIHGVMAFTLWFGVLAFTLVFGYLLDKRYHLLALDEDREEREVERAIAERVGAAVVSASEPGVPGGGDRPMGTVTP